MSSQLQAIRKAIKEKHARELSELEANYAAELAELEAAAAEAAAVAAVEAAAAAVAEATAKKNAAAAAVAAVEAAAAAVAEAAATFHSACGGALLPEEKATMAFKLLGKEPLDDGSAKISDSKDFAGVNYQHDSPLPDCNDEKKAVECLTGRRCRNGLPLTRESARRMVHWKNSMERARQTGELIFLAACGKEGKKHGGEFRRVVGPYTYDPTPLPSGYICYHRYATEHVRNATPEEYEKAMQQRNGNNQCLQWEIDI